MRRRAFCFALLVFQAFWLNVVVPGHTRGIVRLPGCACECSRADEPTCCRTESTRRSHDKPVRDPASGCAICYFAAMLSVPPVIDLAPPQLGLADVLDPPAPTVAASICIVILPRDRGPPAAG